MKNLDYLFLLSLTIALCVSSCSETEAPIDQEVYGYRYFPLEVGQSRTYQVDSIQFDIGQGNLPVLDSSTFYLREDFVERFANQLGEEIFRIERYRAPRVDGPWSIYDVTTESRSVNQAYRTEDNFRYINMVFPLKPGLRWDGNAFIDEDRIIFVRGEAIQMFRNWEYEVLQEGAEERVGDLDYSEVLTIQQAADTNAIEIRFSLEKYAKDVGRIYHEQGIMDSYCKYTGQPEQCVGLSWREKAGRGFIVRETLIAHNR